MKESGIMLFQRLHEFLPVLERLAQCLVIHEFDFGSKGDALGESRHSHARKTPAYKPPDKFGRVFALHSRA